VSEYNQAALVAQASLSQFQFSQYAAKLYEFIWMIYCDWFVELLKPRLQNAVQAPAAEKEMTAKLLKCGLSLFDGSLRLLHPLMPFVTEEIWQRLALGAESKGSFTRDGQTIGLLTWPDSSLKNFPTDNDAIAQMRLVQAVVNAVRTVRGQYSLHPALSLTVYLKNSVAVSGASSERNCQARFGKHLSQMEFLAKAQFVFEDKLPKVIGAALVEGIEVFVDLEGHVDAPSEVAKLKERIKKLGAVLAGINSKLSSAKFVEGAPAEIVAGAKLQQKANEAEKALLERVLLAMGGLP
jgi:valyl-tRNA synthetase